MPNLTGQSVGRYQIFEQLGEGGMATVYKAYDTRLERDVAVKVLRTDQFIPAQLDMVLQRFEREAKSLAKLKHANIVNILDFGEHEGKPYLVMEYLPGGTLKQKLGQAISWQTAFHTLLPVARGLTYAHQHNLIHRDVKPGNILIDENEEPVLTDFGIAKLLEGTDGHTLTGTGVGIGTPEYMAPEQGIGESTIDARADIYSLGIVLYEMVVGRKPYMADTPMAVVLKQMNDPLPRPTDFVPDLPEGVEKILFKALAKQPEDRYADMNALIAAMEDLLAESQQPEALAVPVPSRKVKKKAAPRAKPSDKGDMAITGRPTKVIGQGWYKNPRLWGVLTAVAIIILGFVNAPRIGDYLASLAPTSTASPTVTMAKLPTITPTTPTRTPRPTSTPTPLPAWVTDFAEPIFAAIADHKPDIQDDFSTEIWGWSTNESPYTIEEGVLRAEKNPKRLSANISNVYFSNTPNFVVMVDISPPSRSNQFVSVIINNRFDENESGIYLNSGGWSACALKNACQGGSKSWPNNRKVQITVIVRGSQVGFYLDGSPVAYFNEPKLVSSPVQFHCDDYCEIDNVKFWDLDEIPNLP